MKYLQMSKTPLSILLKVILKIKNMDKTNAYTIELKCKKMVLC